MKWKSLSKILALGLFLFPCFTYCLVKKTKTVVSSHKKQRQVKKKLKTYCYKNNEISVQQCNAVQQCNSVQPCNAVQPYNSEQFIEKKIMHSIVEKPVIVVIPSYNNEKWVEKNLTSVFKQNYKNFRVIYVDDCSTDNTYQKVLQLVEEYQQQGRVTVLHNELRHGALANLYTVIHECDDNSIIITVDGDDWLPHDDVLAYINEVYTEKDIWMTYGQFVEYPTNIICYNYSKTFSEDVIVANSFRKVEQLPISHLRTFYAWLFKSIKLQDMFYEGAFYSMAWDKVMMAPMIEMSGHRFYCVPDALYVYNNANPLNDHRVNNDLQHSLAWYVLGLPAYKQLDAPRMVDVLEEFDCISLILFCQNRPSAQIIENILKHKNKYEDIFVLFPNDNEQCEHVGDTGITLVPYTESDFGQQCIKCLQSIKCHYVQLSAQVESLDIDTRVCAKLLKETQVDVLFGLCVNNSEIACLINQKKLPKVSFKYHAYALYPKNYNANWMLSVIEKAIWRQKTLIAILNESDVKTFNELGGILDKYIYQNNKLGLLLDLIY